MQRSEYVFSESEQILSPFTGQPKVYFITSGYVTAATIDDTGKHRIHLIYGPGSYFPILSVFRGTPQRATYVALTDVEASAMSVQDFKTAVQNDPIFSNEVLEKTIDQLALFADRIIDLQLTKLDERMLYKLKILARAHGTEAKAGMALPYRLKHHHLADMLGVERESATRSLKRLMAQGQISTTKNKHLVIRVTE